MNNLIPDFEKMNGLVPAIVINTKTKNVLMLGYMNKEAYELTLSSGFVYFWSRSRQNLWLKGETSGSKFKMKSMKLDCDRDTLLLEVDPSGPACHTEATSCFLFKII